jgi:hypothetical protein
MRKLRLITRFYMGIFLANSLITLSTIYIMWLYKANAVEIIGVLFWFKIISLGIIIYAAVYYNKNQLYYYQNLGISKVLLMAVPFAFDFLLWLTLIIIVA